MANPAPAGDPLDSSDPYARPEQTFPVLSHDMAMRVARFGSRESLADGDYIFRRGERAVDFFLVCAGEIAIIDHGDHGEEGIVHSHRERQFTGELDLFNDRKILVSGRAVGPSEVVRITASEAITLHPFSEVTALAGAAHLERLVWRNRKTGEETETPVGALFVMIGAQPCSDWLQGCAALDDSGFIVTGNGCTPFETSRPGLFAVGDVRSGSVKRVASGVGEGSVMVQAVHQYIERQKIAEMG